MSKVCACSRDPHHTSSLSKERKRISPSMPDPPGLAKLTPESVFTLWSAFWASRAAFRV